MYLAQIAKQEKEVFGCDKTESSEEGTDLPHTIRS